MSAFLQHTKTNFFRNNAYLAYVSATIGILGWVVSGDNPNQFIREAYNSGKYHADLIRKSESGKDLYHYYSV